MRKKSDQNVSLYLFLFIYIFIVITYGFDLYMSFFESKTFALTKGGSGYIFLDESPIMFYVDMFLKFILFVLMHILIFYEYRDKRIK